VPHRHGNLYIGRRRQRCTRQQFLQEIAVARDESAGLRRYDLRMPDTAMRQQRRNLGLQPHIALTVGHLEHELPLASFYPKRAARRCQRMYVVHSTKRELCQCRMHDIIGRGSDGRHQTMIAAHGRSLKR